MSLHLRRLLRVVEHGTSLLNKDGGGVNGTKSGDGTSDPRTGTTIAEVTASPAAVPAGAAEAMPVSPPVAGGGGHASPIPSLAPYGGERSGGGDVVTGAVKSSQGDRGAENAMVEASTSPDGGLVAAIKLARILGGAAVMPPTEGIKRGHSEGGKQVLHPALM